MEKVTMMLGEYGPYRVNCYYCHEPVTRETHGWNAQDSCGNLYFVHHKCMLSEESDIRSTKDWNRGERYSQAHVLTNPLAEDMFTAKCGCKVSMLKKRPEGKYSFSVLEHLCYKHKIFKLIRNPISVKLKYKYRLFYYLDKGLEILDKPIHVHYGNLFREAYNTGIIDDPYHEKEFLMDV